MNFGFFAANTKLPAYMKEVLGLDIKSVGWNIDLSALSALSNNLKYKMKTPQMGNLAYKLYNMSLVSLPKKALCIMEDLV